MRRRRAAPFEIPREIFIREERWLVVREHELDPEDKIHADSAKALGTTLRGVTRRDLREIHLAHHDTRAAEAETFLHELLHAVVNMHVAPVSDKEEERFIMDVYPADCVPVQVACDANRHPIVCGACKKSFRAVCGVTHFQVTLVPA